MSKVLFAGHYGFGNVGDEAILSALIRQMAALDEGFQPTVVSGDPQGTERWLGVQTVDWTDLQGIAKQIANVDAVVIGGGGLFHDYEPPDLSSLLTSQHSGLSFYAGILMLGELLGKKRVLAAVGVGPIQTEQGRALTQYAAESACLVTVRDAASKVVLEDLVKGRPHRHPEFVVAADPAWNLTGIREGEGRTKLIEMGVDLSRPLIGVALRDWPQAAISGPWEAQLAAALDCHVEETGGTAVFLPFQRGASGALRSDHEVAHAVQQHMTFRARTHLIGELNDPETASGILALCEVVLAMRMHAALFALRHGKPVVALVYDPKVKELMEQSRLGQYALEIEEWKFERVMETLRAARKSGDVRPADIEGTLRAQAGLTGKMLAAVLDKPALSPAPLHPLLQETVLSKSISLSQVLERERGLREELVKESAIRHRVDEALREAIVLGQKRTRELIEIHRSKSWALLGKYWRLRGLLKLSGTGALSRGPGRPYSASASEILAIGNRAVWKARSWFGVSRGLPHHRTRAIPAKCDVLFFPIIPWAFRTQRPQHLAIEMAKDGHRVLYFKTSFGRGRKIKLSVVSERIFQVTLPGRVDLNLYQDRLAEADLGILQSAFEQAREGLGLHASIQFVEFPFWWPLAEMLRSKFGWPIVYDCLDEHTGFMNVASETVIREADLLRGCDLAIASSLALFEKCKSMANSAIHVPNAVDLELFPLGPSPQPTNGRNARRPTVGYVGAIAEWFDFDLIRHAVKAHPEWRFVLVGGTQGAKPHSDLAARPNVEFLGERPYREVPGILRDLDVCMIPFEVNTLTRSADPVKAYEYLAAGKPVVSVPLPDLARWGGLIRTASTPEEFTAQLEASLNENSPFEAAHRRDSVSAHTWHDRWRTLWTSLQGVLPKVSVVVVTWNNFSLTQACVQSIQQQEAVLDLELIIVDNASEDGTQAWLKRQAEGGKLTPILNRTNSGFAAAVNQGLARASGEVVVILNNDVVLTMGSLAQLTRRVLENPRLGLLGPTTNSVGNEAFATKGGAAPIGLTRNPARSDRTLFTIPIPMLAMYCVAGRTDTFRVVGPLDESFRTGMFEDDDYAIRVRKAGYQVACAPDVFVYHYGQAAFGLRSREQYLATFEANRSLFEEKWAIEWKGHGGTSLADLGTLLHQVVRALSPALSTGKRTVILAPGVLDPSTAMDWMPFVERARQLGNTVLICRSGQDNRPITELGPGLFQVQVPPHLLDFIEEPLVVATASDRAFTFSLRRPQVIYDATGFAQQIENPHWVQIAHRGFLNDAATVGTRKVEDMSALAAIRSDTKSWDSEALMLAEI